MRKLDGPHVNYFLFQQWLMEFDLPDIQLPAGTYWLELSDAKNYWDTATFWGESDGPSLSFKSGNIGGNWKHGGHDGGGSESFRIKGTFH
jgi:hypothetical protein